MLSSRFVCSILLSLLLIASQSVVVTGTDELPSGISSLSLPAIEISMQVQVQEETTPDIYKFRSALIGALNEHFTSTLEGMVPQNSLVAIELDCVLSRFQSSLTSNVRAFVEASCSGSAMVYESFGIGEVEMHSWISEALSGDAYWELLHRFVLDDLLATVQYIDLSVLSDLIQPYDESSTSPEKAPKWRLIVLAIFSSVVGCTILGLGIFAWWTFGECCCGVKTACISMTKEDDKAVEGTDKGSDDDMEVKPTSMAPPTRTTQSKEEQLPASSRPKLTMIDESEEDDSSIVGSISAKIGKMLNSSPTHPYVHGKPVAEERVAV
jgi:hypothetical protein